MKDCKGIMRANKRECGGGMDGMERGRKGRKRENGRD
jgi:hypothetical protein